MVKYLNVLFLKITYKLLRRLDVSRSLYVSRKDNVRLWGISELIEGIVERMENNYQ